jgi:hypothetical protein
MTCLEKYLMACNIGFSAYSTFHPEFDQKPDPALCVIASAFGRVYNIRAVKSTSHFSNNLTFSKFYCISFKILLKFTIRLSGKRNQDE